jgi:hypothetical protein
LNTNRARLNLEITYPEIPIYRGGEYTRITSGLLEKSPWRIYRQQETKNRKGFPPGIFDKKDREATLHT